jgi:hypothetical protein
MRHAVWLVVLVACDGGGPSYYEAGECTPPEAGAPLGAASYAVDTCEPLLSSELVVVDTQAELDAMFPCGTPPVAIDFATQRAAVAAMYCSPIAHRFTSELADEIVIGVFTWPSGACLGNAIVVALPRAAKPVRLAHCYQQCAGDCPQLP